MIPNDLAARLRLLAEAAVNPVSPTRQVTDELPDLVAGQRFTARIDSVRQDGTFRALVAGRGLTLALPDTAAPGDVLDLVVTARTPRLIVAMEAPVAQERLPRATLSGAAQIIGRLLAGGENAVRPASLAGASPMLSATQLAAAPLATSRADAVRTATPAQAPLAALLAPALRQAIVESGLFYEAHQAKWMAGRYPADALAREPQARLAGRRHAPEAPPAAAPPPPTETADETARATGMSPRAGAGTPPGLTVELQPVVQQQLDALATQQLVWRGDVWPGQAMEWEIGPDAHRRDDDADPSAARWTTRLRLTLPSLGEIDVALYFAPEKISLAMTATTEGAAALRRGAGDLTAAFAAAGLPPLAAHVEEHASA